MVKFQLITKMKKEAMAAVIYNAQNAHNNEHYLFTAFFNYTFFNLKQESCFKQSSTQLLKKLGKFRTRFLRPKKV